MFRFRRRQPPWRAIPPSDGEGPVAITPSQLARNPTTDAVLVRPSVIAEAFESAANKPSNEVGGLLLGQFRGRFVVVQRLVPSSSVGSSTRITFRASDFARALDQAEPNQLIVGWYHSHPGHGVFLSPTDLKHQSQSQDQCRDYVALVLDPLRPEGFGFGFHRATRNDEATRIPHHYLLEGADET
jgi:proteasome lid subunit RPN8/RPN11